MESINKSTLVAVGALLWLGQAQASTLDVCGQCQYQSIANAVAAAAPGDTISIYNGTYNEHDITVDKPLTFIGQSQQNTIIDAQDAGRHFSIEASAQVVGFETLSLINGNAENASGCGSSTSYRQGGSICAEGIAMKLWKVNLENNRATRYGGAIYFGGRDTNGDPGGHLLIGKSSFSNNRIEGVATTIDASGGAIACGYCDIVDIFRTEFENNEARKFAPYNKGVPPIWRGTGGAISTWAGNTFDSNQNTFRSNHSVEGGAIALGHYIGTYDESQIINDYFEDNVADSDGGAISTFGYDDLGILKIKRSTFVKNTSENGGAIKTNTPTYINNSTFTKNLAVLRGGALDIARAYEIAGISNSTFHGNAVKTANGGSVIATSSLLTPGDVYMSNNIFTQNNDIECAINFPFGFVVGEHNLTESDSCDPNNGANSSAYGYTLPFTLGPVSDFDSSLQDNGGFTYTHQIGSQSNAVDMGANNCPGAQFGNPLNRDQRGFQRQNQCDIGSFEFQ